MRKVLVLCEVFNRKQVNSKYSGDLLHGLSSPKINHNTNSSWESNSNSRQRRMIHCILHKLQGKRLITAYLINIVLL